MTVLLRMAYRAPPHLPALLSFLSAALRTIDIGIGYAEWAVLLDQPLTLPQAFPLAVIIAGAIWLETLRQCKAAHAVAGR